jgi:hypothetical protein
MSVIGYLFNNNWIFIKDLNKKDVMLNSMRALFKYIYKMKNESKWNDNVIWEHNWWW